MQVWQGLESYPPDIPACTVAIGRFDGVHVGHQALISTAVADAGANGRPCVVFTFDRHPAELFAPERAPEYLSTQSRKSDLIATLGPDHLLIARFDERFRDLSPEAFLHFVVAGMLDARAVFVGQDFRFGYEHVGDVSYLRSAEERFCYRTTVVPAVQLDGEKAASRRVRELLKEGELARATRILGHPHVLEGTVVQGQQLGRTLGYPTANLDVTGRQVVPRDGIYAVRAYIDGEPHGGACSIGMRPTVNGDSRTVETFLLDFDGDLYGRQMVLEFVARLRDEERFGSLDAMVEQIARDVQRTKQILASG